MSDTLAETGTTFDVDPQQADWYYCAVIKVFGETDYVDGYASGDEPTQEGLQEYSRCRHVWMGGMCYVDDEDVEAVAAEARVECERCDATYHTRNDRRFVKPLKILEWEVKATPHGKHSDKWVPATD